jgi:hypothetical protein
MSVFYQSRRVVKARIKTELGQSLNVIMDTMTGKQLMQKYDFSHGIYPNLAIIVARDTGKHRGRFSWYEIREIVERRGPTRVFIEAFHVSEDFYFRDVNEALDTLKQRRTKSRSQREKILTDNIV